MCGERFISTGCREDNVKATRIVQVRGYQVLSEDLGRALFPSIENGNEKLTWKAFRTSR